jgi:hypothetical protein
MNNGDQLNSKTNSISFMEGLILLRKEIRIFIKVLGICFCSYELKEVLVSFAGKDTNIFVELFAKLITDFRIEIYIALVLLPVIWALGEKFMRHQVTKRLHTRIEILESQKDPNRSTSGLMITGETNPKDLDI